MTRLALERAERAAADALPKLAAALLGVAARLSTGAAVEPRPRRRAWIAVAVLLTLGPFLFTVSREGSFSASVDLFPAQVGPYQAVTAPAAYRDLLEDEQLRQEMSKNVGVVPQDVSITRRPDGRSLRVTVSTPLPQRAAIVVNALAVQIAQATRRQLIAAVPSDIARVRRALRSGMLTREERRRHREVLRVMRKLLPTPPPRVAIGSQAKPGAPTRWADRLVDRLPGEFPRRPSPLATALAGLLLAGTLWGLGLVLFPPRRAEP